MLKNPVKSSLKEFFMIMKGLKNIILYPNCLIKLSECGYFKYLKGAYAFLLIVLK